jgi:DNA-binding CsgD family transcriptional regulator
MQQSDLLRCIGLIYDAAVDTARWQYVLNDIAEQFGGKVSLALHDQKSGRPTFLATANWEEDWVADYVAYYAPINPWTANLQNIPVQSAACDDVMFPKAALRKTEFYQDWLRPQRLEAATAAVVFNDKERFLNISVMHESERFQEECLRLFQGIIPHLQRAAQINRQISGLQVNAQSMERTFDYLDRGVVLLDGEGKAFYCNRHAKEYFDRMDGLVLGRDGKILCVGHGTQSKLDASIAQARATSAGFGSSAGDIIAIPRAHGGMPWSVMVAPMPASAMDLGRPEGAVVLFIIDPDKKPALSIAALRTVLGLTAAEARVAIALANGNTPEEIADKLGITTLTVRTHLRNAMSKTETRRLAELVALVLRCGG